MNHVWFWNETRKNQATKDISLPLTSVLILNPILLSRSVRNYLIRKEVNGVFGITVGACWCLNNEKTFHYLDHAVHCLNKEVTLNNLVFLMLSQSLLLGLVSCLSILFISDIWTLLKGRYWQVSMTLTGTSPTQESYMGPSSGVEEKLIARWLFSYIFIRN